MAHEAECDVLARRIETSAQGEWRRTFAYGECTVLTAPNDLPDGDYMAYFAGHSFPVNRTRGLWTPIGEAVPDSYARNLPEGRTVVPVQPPSKAAASPDDSKDADHAAERRQSPPSRSSEN